MKFYQEFREFAVKGNALELAVGVVIGSAFTGVVNAIVEDVLNPILSLLTGRVDFSHLKFAIFGHGVMYGLLLNAIINFLLVSFAVFLVIRQINKLRRKRETASTEKTCQYCKTSIPLDALRCPNCTSQLA